MIKIGDKIYRTEEDVSPSYRSPDFARVIAIPLCNVCKNWDGPGKCKKFSKSPDAYRTWERRDCSEAVLDTKRFNFSQFSEFYPEDTKKLLERQEKQEGSEHAQDNP